MIEKGEKKMRMNKDKIIDEIYIRQYKYKYIDD